jgi:CheY-like chemotaxis protein
MHGGSVQAFSPGQDQGATFKISLPLIAIYRADPEENGIHPGTRSLLPPADLGERLDGIRVLVVDDEPDTRKLLKIGLENCGAEVLLAGSPTEALRIMETDVPDVLISDIGMPDQDGYDLIRQVRALPAPEGGTVPAIALTAYARVEDRLKALRSGYQMHVPKPVELAELVAVTDSLVSRLSRSRK